MVREKNCPLYSGVDDFANGTPIPDSCSRLEEEKRKGFKYSARRWQSGTSLTGNGWGGTWTWTGVVFISNERVMRKSWGIEVREEHLLVLNIKHRKGPKAKLVRLFNILGIHRSMVATGEYNSSMYSMLKLVPAGRLVPQGP